MIPRPGVPCVKSTWDFTQGERRRRWVGVRASGKRCMFYRWSEALAYATAKADQS